MNIVTELNKLAEELTGTNPQCTLDAEAVKYLKNNLSGKVEFEIDNNFMGRYFTTTGQGLVSNEEDVALLNKLDEEIKNNNNANVVIKYDNDGTIFKLVPIIGIKDGEFSNIQVEILKIDDDMNYSVLLGKLANGNYFYISKIYTKTPVSNEENS